MSTQEPDELTYINLKLGPSGNSTKVTVPSEVLDEASAGNGDGVCAIYDRKAETITYLLG
jgi:hypothetical protein